MKPHSLLRITESLYDTPLLISRATFRNIEKYLDVRNAGLMKMPKSKPKCDEPEGEDDCEFEESIVDNGLDDKRGIGVIDINGPLTFKRTGWEAACGGISYEQILDELEDLIEGGATKVVMQINSGGGEAFGCFESADKVRSMCDEAGVTLYSYVLGSACSAAYALACVSDYVVANKYSEVGSLGVLISLCDDSKQLEQAGIKMVYVTAGKEKIPYAEDGSFRPEFLADLQDKVEYLYSEFAAHVSKYTGLSTEEIIGTQAKVFMAKDALPLGLINQIMNQDEFIQYIIRN